MLIHLQRILFSDYLKVSYQKPKIFHSHQYQVTALVAVWVVMYEITIYCTVIKGFQLLHRSVETHTHHCQASTCGAG
jgi:hypothetical protein